MDRRKGITLVALVITIIILLILAGIVVGLTIGQEGIITRAQQAGKNYMTAQEEESNQLEKLLAYENLLENAKDTEAGTKVKLPENWYSTAPVYVLTEDGRIVKEVERTASVEAVAVGNGETVPVPQGFYYVGGNLSSGVVISDHPDDQNKYAGQADVPSGVKVENGKFVDELKGNQFVFIPCNESEYHKYDEWNGQKQTEGLCDALYDLETPIVEKKQATKYGGFYVGRFEAGIAEGMEEKNIEYNTNGTPQSKAGKIPWDNISFDNARANAQNMYRDNSGVISGLMTGSGFDTTLKMMIKQGALTEVNTVSPEEWGNCADTIVTYTGRIKQSQNFNFGPFNKDIETGTTTVNANGTGIIFTTGASEECKRYNIYDIAGNVFELTDEVTMYASNIIHPNIRGGAGANHSTASYGNKVASRYSRDFVTSGETTGVGYRVVLYMK